MWPLILSVVLFQSGNPANAAAPTSQPVLDHDPSVFRCVLDNNARMIVIDLGDHWWMAFDAEHCAIHKIWKGDIELTGAVYDTKHGPQPKAIGDAILDGSKSIHFDAYSALTNKGASAAAPQWKGYELKAGRPTLKWEQEHVRFELTPTIEGNSLRFTLETNTNDDAWAVIAHIPNAISFEINPAADVDGGAVESTVKLPGSGSSTFRIDLIKSAAATSPATNVKESGK